MAAPQSDILSGSGIAHELLRALVHAAHNHGCNDEHVRRLLTDKTLQAAVGRLLRGDIWKLVDDSVDLDVDWDSPWTPTFLSSMTVNNVSAIHATPAPKALQIRRPAGRWKYRLTHYEFPVKTEQVCADHVTAGIRELCTYARDVTIPPQSIIVALGDYEQTPPNGMQYFGQAIIGPDPANDRMVCRIANQSAWDTKYFFLVREEVK